MGSHSAPECPPPPPPGFRVEGGLLGPSQTELRNVSSHSPEDHLKRKDARRTAFCTYVMKLLIHVVILLLSAVILLIRKRFVQSFLVQSTFPWSLKVRLVTITGIAVRTDVLKLFSEVAVQRKQQCHTDSVFRFSLMALKKGFPDHATFWHNSPLDPFRQD